MQAGEIGELTQRGKAAAVRLAKRLGLPHDEPVVPPADDAGPHWQDGFAISLWEHVLGRRKGRIRRGGREPLGAVAT